MLDPFAYRIRGGVILILKYRIDYFPSIERLVLRMHTPVHEYFLCSLVRRITQQLDLLSSESGSVADFAKDIRCGGSTTLRARDPKYGRHDPDSSFRHLKSPFPTVIIEVAHSQKVAGLGTLAEEYILGSYLKIGVLVGVKIDYRSSKRATFFVWRAVSQGPDDDKVWRVEPTEHQVVLADSTALYKADIVQIFRHDDGTPNIDQNVGLCLPLKDFADQKTCRQFKDIDRNIFVSCAELYQYLEEAETVAKIDKATELEETPEQTMRPRTQTPEEQLNDRDEAAYAADEARVSERQHLDDASYKASSSSEGS